jgi:hypothetical protein
MADIKDVSQTIASALGEVGVTGTLDVNMDGAEKIITVGETRDDDLEIHVVVKQNSTASEAPVYVTLPNPHAGPFAGLSDADLGAAHSREAAGPGSQVAEMLHVELQHRGLV